MRPPALLRALLLRTLPPSTVEAVVGDLDEEFEAIARTRGVAAARAWYRRMGLASWWACWCAAPWGHSGGAPRSGGRGVSLGPPAGGRGPGRSGKIAIGGLMGAARALRRDLGFSTLVVLTLALALGANVAVFSIANATMFRPVPGVPDSNEMILVQFEQPNGDGTGASWPNISDMVDNAGDLATFTTFAPGGFDARPEQGPPTTVRGEGVPTGYFDFLGVVPAIGRLPTEEGSNPSSAERWVVISQHLWETLYGRSSDVLGQGLELNGNAFEIVGVTREFRGAQRRGNSDVFFPVAFYSVLRYGEEAVPLEDRSWRAFFQLLGRPAPGVDAETVQTRLRESMARLVSAYPVELEIHSEYVPTVYEGVGTPTWQRASAARTLRILGMIVALVLLIAAANVASLLIARGAARRGDTAVRRALGASASRIVSERVFEGIVLALPATVLGLLTARVLTTVLFQVSEGQSLLASVPPLDARVVTFAALVALTTAVTFSLLPALFARRVDVRAALVDASGRHSRGAAHVRSGLTVLQVGFSLVLLIGATLLARTLGALHATELGFDAESVSVMAVDPGHQGYDGAAADLLFEQLVLDLRTHPELAAVGMGSLFPFGGGLFRTRLRTEEQTDDQVVQPNVQWVAAGYFEALAQDVVLGRFFTREELTVPEGEFSNATLLSRSLASQLFGDPRAALGRRVVQPLDGGPREAEVVGIVDDARMRSLREPEPLMYLPFQARWGEAGSVVLRSRVGHAETVRLVQEALAKIDAGIPVSRARALPDLVREATAEERLFATLLSVMAGLAGTLAAVGLYGVIAYTVAQRRMEFSIRIALGADAPHLVRGVLRHGMFLGLAGVALGWLGAAAFTRVLASRLYGVEPLDLVTFLGAAVAFVAVTAFASAMPARATTTIDPVQVLRDE